MPLWYIYMYIYCVQSDLRICIKNIYEYLSYTYMYTCCRARHAVYVQLGSFCAVPAKCDVA